MDLVMNWGFRVLNLIVEEVKIFKNLDQFFFIFIFIFTFFARDWELKLIVYYK